jgi:hypothetical protein
VAKWSTIAALPGLSQAASLLARNAARSYEAAVLLGEKALAYQKQSRKAIHRRVGPLAPKE